MSAAVVAAAVGGVVSSGPAVTAESNRPALALGDSVVFGYITQAGYDYVNPQNFVGFPEHAGPELHLHITNPSCPGETSGSLISTAEVDNGCKAFRHGAPLHVAYIGSQLDYAVAFVHHHRDTRMVSILVGANDGFLVLDGCAGDPTCIQTQLPIALAKIGHNLDTIFHALRKAGFHGVLVGMTYYSVDYTDASGTGFAKALNAVIRDRTLAAGGVVADGFGAFKTAAFTSFAGGHTCKAGLLNAVPDPAHEFECDVHPSQSGQEVLARALSDAYLGAHDGGDDSGH
ncbi:MAG TPA: SGNH/GDSL hydrolase family protein [Candidatus Dormibacteraeota bacterium]|nr:SGNH/GDSL hydrolase family protein [Candidatus Dormibacteraeota bacterium]